MASAAMLTTIVAIPATSMLKARLGSNAKGHVWGQSSGNFDLDHAALRPLGQFRGRRKLSYSLSGVWRDPPKDPIDPSQTWSNLGWL